jgi:hypothetical protein
LPFLKNSTIFENSVIVRAYDNPQGTPSSEECIFL